MQEVHSGMLFILCLPCSKCLAVCSCGANGIPTAGAIIGPLRLRLAGEVMVTVFGKHGVGVFWEREGHVKGTGVPLESLSLKD